jgi:hypothetical protein
LSERIGNALSINVINEVNSNGFFGIADRIRNNKFTSPVIVEHAEVYNLLTAERTHNISDKFDKIIAILLNVSDDILTTNLADRKSRGATGDYLKIDIFDMKKQVEHHFNGMNCNVKYISTINSFDDYEHEYKKIIDFLSDKLRTE